jgi:uncharacterized tellurite resistance protein B-like protein
MFGRWLAKAEEDLEGNALAKVVHGELAAADADTRRIVTAIVGLLGGVAYADRDYAETEEALLRAHLRRIQGLSEAAVEAVLRVLRTDILLIATVQAPRYCRALLEFGDRELRLQVLSLLVDVAAADGRISNEEVVLLRNTTTALGLDQADYNAAQAPHRDKLSTLR